MPWLVAPGVDFEDWDSERGGGDGGDNDDDDTTTTTNNNIAVPCAPGQYVAGRVRVWGRKQA